MEYWNERNARNFEEHERTLAWLNTSMFMSLYEWTIVHYSFFSLLYISLAIAILPFPKLGLLCMPKCIWVLPLALFYEKKNTISLLLEKKIDYNI